MYSLIKYTKQYILNPTTGNFEYFPLESAPSIWLFKTEEDAKEYTSHLIYNVLGEGVEPLSGNRGYKRLTEDSKEYVYFFINKPEVIVPPFNVF